MSLPVVDVIRLRDRIKTSATLTLFPGDVDAVAYKPSSLSFFRSFSFSFPFNSHRPLTTATSPCVSPSVSHVLFYFPTYPLHSDFKSLIK